MIKTFEPMVSVIIPCFNAERFIGQSIYSALSQGKDIVEVIVIDDGSTDGSLGVIKGFGECIKVRSGPNRGGNSARNIGLFMAAGKYIKFLDADDYLLPGCIRKELDIARAGTDRDLVIGRTYNLEEESGILRPHAKRDGRRGRSESLFNTILDVPVISAPLYPRKKIIQIGGFNESLSVRQDFDLFLRVMISGMRPMFVDVSSFVYRTHSCPGRVSKQKTRKRALDEVALYQSLLVLMEEYGSENEAEIRSSLSASSWVTGRNALRCGHREEALKLFEMAVDFNSPPAMVGSRIYKAVSFLTNPVVAEDFLSGMKRLPVLRKLRKWIYRDN